jgi:hypothetical protein
LWQPNPTVCKSTSDAIKRELREGKEVRSIPGWNGVHTDKRFIFSLVGDVAHSLFRVFDSDSEAFYNQKIAQLEEEELLDWLKLIREKTVAVWST